MTKPNDNKISPKYFSILWFLSFLSICLNVLKFVIVIIIWPLCKLEKCTLFLHINFWDEKMHNTVRSPLRWSLQQMLMLPCSLIILFPYRLQNKDFPYYIFGIFCCGFHCWKWSCIVLETTLDLSKRWSNLMWPVFVGWKAWWLMKK